MLKLSNMYNYLLYRNKSAYARLRGYSTFSYSYTIIS